ncbi:30S ribosomal protein S13 [endosymbiont of Pachyrhynchus infernalis]|uniref:30S ribosomal protein S13 n=1 Tax=endosymbiont of Pachyrhynchus infernalis TaxID=1971488 RepID=UPI000DC733A0|nr:30S ribosomal protein S13 [endosymbiont of Pachyrhynchus infernalis]BBA84853.1 30S ribosomal protein S13 [endosymbiont of Pachyrhynchus infernalis]
MTRIAGVNIPNNKYIYISLTYIYGIGFSLSKKICKCLNINLNTKVSDLSNQNIEDIKKELNKYIIENDLKRINYFNIKKLIDLGSYRGIRHKKHLPVRGQRTRTNAKTCKKYLKDKIIKNKFIKSKVLNEKQKKRK